MDGSLPLIDGFLASPDRFLWHPPTRTAVLADLHLGAEHSLAKAGILMPPIAQQATYRSWQRLAAAGPARLILAGDLFDTPEAAEGPPLNLLHSWLQLLPPTCHIHLTPGNHDPAPPRLRQLLEPLGVAIAPSTLAGPPESPWGVLHGDSLSQLPASPRPLRGIIVGHQHPAVVLATRVRSAKMPCFALAKTALSNAPHLLLLPAFSRLPLGSNLLTERNWLLNTPRPRDHDLRIAGIVEPAASPDSSTPSPGQVLDFGPLSGLSSL